MRIEIYFNDSLEKGLTELEKLSSSLIGNMKLSKSTVANGNLQFVSVELEELDDFVAVMQAMRDMAKNGDEWTMMVTSGK